MFFGMRRPVLSRDLNLAELRLDDGIPHRGSNLGRHQGGGPRSSSAILRIHREPFAWPDAAALRRAEYSQGANDPLAAAGVSKLRGLATDVRLAGGR